MMYYCIEATDGYCQEGGQYHQPDDWRRYVWRGGHSGNGYGRMVCEGCDTIGACDYEVEMRQLSFALFSRSQLVVVSAL